MKYKKAYELVASGYTTREAAAEVGYSWEATRKGIRKYAKNNGLPSVQELQAGITLGKGQQKSRKVLSDGSIVEEIEKHFRENREPKTPDDYMLLHGYDQNYFDFVNGESTTWTVTNAQGETFWNVRSKIKVKLKDEQISQEELLDRILKQINSSKKTIKPIIERKSKGKTHLAVPLFDLHHHPDDHGYYAKFLGELVKTAEYYKFMSGDDVPYKSTTIILDGDALEHDNFVFTTESGTRTEDRRLTTDYTSLYVFLESLMDTVLEISEKVKFVYIRGNHAPSMTWAVAEKLCTNYPQVEADIDETQTLKATKIGDSFVGIQHGDIRASKRDLQSLAYLYKDMFSECNYHYSFSGHLHTDKEFLKDNTTFYCIDHPSPKFNNDWA